MKPLCLFLFTATLLLHAQAQRITLNGNIFSFKGEKVMLLKKAQKNVSFDGSLENVVIRVMGESTNSTITTGLSGSFSIPLENPGHYKIEISRSGYSSLDIHVNYTDAGKKTRFESLYFILKQDDNASAHLGTIEVNEGLLSFTPDNDGSDKSKNDLLQSNVHLIEKAVLINKSGGGSYVANTPVKEPKEINKNSKTTVAGVRDTSTTRTPKKNQNEIFFLLGNEGETNLDSLKNQLSKEKDLLKQ